MNFNQVESLSTFEENRKECNIIPPAGSNSFYNIGEGQIDLLTMRDDPDDYRFKLTIRDGTVHIGDDRFVVAGDIHNTKFPYHSIQIMQSTTLVDDFSSCLSISSGCITCHGTLELDRSSQLIILNQGNVTIEQDGSIIISDKSIITIDTESHLNIYGTIYIDMHLVKNLLDHPNIYIDPAVVLIVTGLESLGRRLFSLTDYYNELDNQIININTQGEKNFIRGIGRIGYKWVAGNPNNQSQYIDMYVLYGDAILGDYKFSVLGLPESEIHNRQIISVLHVEKDTTLHICETYGEYKYQYPELHVGVIIDNCKLIGCCKVDGKIIADGENASVTLDRGGIMMISEGAEVHLRNHATMRVTHVKSDYVSLMVNGTLIIDDIEQISSFEEENISIGYNGKIIILNPDTGERRLLWSTPNGLETTDLYRLFKDRLFQVEYHISNNTGIKIDQFYKFYAKDFRNWYNGMRIEKAIHEGYIVWHDGAFIELDSEIIPWVNKDCSLLQAARLFKSTGSYDSEKLQEVVNRLKYAGCGNILFRFIDGEDVSEVTLVLDEINMKNVINNPMTNTYKLFTDADGELFMRNNISIVTPENIIVDKATMIDVNDKTGNIVL